MDGFVKSLSKVANDSNLLANLTIFVKDSGPKTNY